MSWLARVGSSIRVAAQPRTFSALRRITTGRFFTDQHEWVDVKEDGTGRIGISDHAQAELGDVVFIDLPPVGEKVAKGSQLAVVESVKASAPVYSPVSGEVCGKQYAITTFMLQIIDVNKAVLDDNSLLNSSAEKDGWMVQVKLGDPEELKGLMDTSSYEKFVKSSAH